MKREGPTPGVKERGPDFGVVWRQGGVALPSSDSGERGTALSGSVYRGEMSQAYVGGHTKLSRFVAKAAQPFARSSQAGHVPQPWPQA